MDAPFTASAFWPETPVDILAAKFLYGVHLVSMPCWIFVGLWAVWKQRDLKAECPKSKQLIRAVPPKGEYWAIRFLAAYTIMDFLRGADLCFDSTDGVCRAVWGVAPWWFRCTAWVARDLALLTAIGFQLYFYLGWTHEALEWTAPQQLQTVMHGALGIVLSAVAASFYALAATNRQSWQVIAVVFVIILNVVWAWTNVVILKKVLPAMEKRLQDVQGIVRPSLPLWVVGAVAEVRLASRLILTANIAILTLFPMLVVERIFFRHAHTTPFHPGNGLDEWVGHRVPPLLSDRPEGVALNPALEVVELLIGWLQFVYVYRMATAPSSTRVSCSDLTMSFHDEAALGEQFRWAAFGSGSKKGQ